MANLLDRSSLVLTPTAYNNGEALCIKPDDGSGDFDFSRNSAATRVNAQGLVENVQILSSNLVQNGDFSVRRVQRRFLTVTFHKKEVSWLLMEVLQQIQIGQNKQVGLLVAVLLIMIFYLMQNT